MNKEFLVALLEKDIRELELLTEGFEDLELFPKPILKLARQKAENIIENLSKLENLTTDKKEIIQQEEKKVEIKTVEETPQTTKTEFVDKTKQVEENVIEIIEIPEEETTEETEAVEFVEDIKEYAIQDKISLESTEIEEIEVVDEKQDFEEKTASEEIIIDSKKDSQASVTIKTEIVESENTSNSINENIKINDIRQAINIGDRFRFQRELFNGNGEVMNKTIAYLNQLAKYEEAISFLNNKFGWAKDNQHAEDFLQIIRRRYL